MEKGMRNENKSEQFIANQGRFKTLDKDELADIASKGGQATATKYRNRKKIKDIADIMLSGELQGTARKKIAQMFPELDEEDLTYTALIVFAQIMAAAGEKNVNSRAFEILCEMQDSTTKNEDGDPLSDALEKAAKQL